MNPLAWAGKGHAVQKVWCARITKSTPNARRAVSAQVISLNVDGQVLTREVGGIGTPGQPGQFPRGDALEPTRDADR